MLSIENRLRSRADFSDVVRHGRRASRPLLTVHALLAAAPVAADPAPPAPARAGLVVSKAVGNSVVRHRTARRLRHLLRDGLDTVPAGARLVVRAAPAAAEARSPALAVDLESALTAALRPRTPR